MTRRAARTDGNQAGIVGGLRIARCGVLILSAVGDGCPDLLVHGPVAPWPSILLEIKNPAQKPSERRLTPEQVKFHAAWKGPKAVVMTLDDALDAVSACYRTLAA